MIIVNYEVYVLEQSRGWMLHARFPRQERETAINEAKELEQTLNIRVKVVRETYYTDDNKFEEAEVYISGTKSGASSRPAPSRAPPVATARPAARKPAAAPGKAKAKPAKARPEPEEPVEEVRPKKAAKAHQLLGRLLMITGVALATALLAIKITPGAILLLWDWGFHLDVTPENYGQVLFAVFVLTFLMVAVPLALRFLPRQTEIPTFHRNPRAAMTPLQANQALQRSLDKLADKAMAEQQRLGFQDEEQLPPVPEPAPEAAEPEPQAEEPDLPEIAPGPDEALPEITPDPEDAKPAAAEPTVAVAEEDQGSGSLSAADAHQPMVARFLSGAVAAVKAAVPVLDSYNKFALHLYLAGGVETLCEFKRIAQGGKVKLLTGALETIGTKADLGRKFYERIEEYMLEPRYLGVVQAGRDAMTDFLGGDEAGAHGKIKTVMKDWNKPAEKKASIVTVMFTDMVGSTDLTQERGDAAAQEIVRRHNSIVRGALAQFGGKEIKHTGDGIMASFASAASAVEATVSIQRQVIANNERTPDLELHLRIGLNAGEPIEEEDDLFGTTVQLAARVCAATNSDQILCTGVVKDLSFGKGGNFRAMGEKVLKGFKDPIALFEVVWR
ncbi:MAG: adenylate/guanylate cyclase domain-containing protein [Solirubrobacterales bacterium]